MKPLRVMPLLAVLSIPVLGVGCQSTQKQTNNDDSIVPLANYRQRVPAMRLFDVNHDEVLSYEEAKKYVMEMIDDGDGELSGRELIALHEMCSQLIDLEVELMLGGAIKVVHHKNIDATRENFNRIYDEGILELETKRRRNGKE